MNVITQKAWHNHVLKPHVLGSYCCQKYMAYIKHGNNKTLFKVFNKF